MEKDWDWEMAKEMEKAMETDLAMDSAMEMDLEMATARGLELPWALALGLASHGSQSRNQPAPAHMPMQATRSGIEQLSWWDS